MENQSKETPKKNSNVIYFLIVVVVALLGTDVYLFMQKNKSDVRVTSTQDVNSRLKVELDSLEAQMEQVSSGKARVSAQMVAMKDSLNRKIQVLRGQLAKGKLTEAELTKVQEDVKQLRYFVTKYTADIEELKKQNQSLATERDTLKSTLTTVSQKATDLEKQNQDLNTKVEAASALKIGAASVTAYKIRGSGKEVDVTRAGSAKKLKINFTIASNPVALKGSHDVFLRVIDPTGNLITTPETGTFTADGQDLQYTYRTSIDYNDDGVTYPIDWVNPSEFQKGTYTIILYSDKSTMGKTSITLK